ncbi:MAG: hypothetical protein ABSF44_04305 [Candidatus Bathyarchaeia archaeon]|jgi:hypothetical protein
MLLNPGSPNNWGQSDVTPASFGVQDPEFTQYELSAFSLMRLGASGDLLEYDKTPNNMYTRVTPGAGAALVTPNADALNYSKALTLLGIKGTYGFQLSLTPDVTVSVSETHSCSPLTLSLTATGASFPFANAEVNYCLFLVTLGSTPAQYPSYELLNGTTFTDTQGKASVTFSTVTDPSEVYAFIAYARLDGVVGVGYHTRTSESDQYLVPVVQDIGSQTIVLAHSYDLNNSNAPTASLKYNATFVISTQDYTLSELSLGSGSGTYGYIMSGIGNPVENVTLPTCTTGILILTYQESASLGGVIIMPWGISALGFPVNFGGNPSQQEWVATDLRQVMIGDVAYQAKLSLWSTKAVQVTG